MTKFWKLSACLLTIVIFNSPGIDAQLPNKLLKKPNDPANICKRICKLNERPRQCEYNFVIESYRTMSKSCYNCPFTIIDCFRPECIAAVGRKRNIVTINRQIPGPAIEVCKGDTIIVNVYNEMISDSVTIHWHGLLQKNTPFMDGVPYVTQCPILAGQAFRYSFLAEDSGTFYYHSHMGSQVSDGLFGPLIIREPPEQNHQALEYDFDDHTVIINDWSNEDGMSSLLRGFHDTLVGPATILINGRGLHQAVPGRTFSAFTPMEVFQVQPNGKYRFRLINSGADDCPMDVSIDNHKLLIIALDGNDIQPVEVDAITIWSGERIDFVVTTNQRPKNYWFRVNGYTSCANTNAYQVAILRYGKATSFPTGAVGHMYLSSTAVVYNPFNIGTEVRLPTNVPMTNLRAIEQIKNLLPDTVNQQIFITFDLYNIDNVVFHRSGIAGINQVRGSQRLPTSQFNHISMKFPPVPLLTQRNEIPPESVCTRESLAVNHTDCIHRHCRCLHIIKIPTNNIVELVLIDEGTNAVVNHPMHLHGHKFRVVAMENLDGPVTLERFQQLDRAGKITRYLSDGYPPLKDTIKVPNGGYSIVRFRASNPGYWLFHCHFETHLNEGMALVFQVGEHREMVIPVNFPQC